jgi:hypothetical protein
MLFSFSALRERSARGHLHVHPITAWRRLGIIVVTLSLSAFLFRGYVSAGLVNRGDDLLRAGEAERSVHFYQRAMFFDPTWETPVDRLAFAASMSGNARAFKYGIAVATAYLDRNPSSEKVRWDRAMCYLHLKMRKQGYADMTYLARASFPRHDADARRYADISYNLAIQLGKPNEARNFAEMRDVR